VNSEGQKCNTGNTAEIMEAIMYNLSENNIVYESHEERRRSSGQTISL
jgi:hypothetical protein